MPQPARRNRRIFKTAWFGKAARKAGIEDNELCRAIQQVMKGQVSDLGGGVFKKRLNKNMHRSVVLAKGGQYWVFAYLFAKRDRANIEADELEEFRQIAKAYEMLTGRQLSRLLTDKDLTEICHDDQAQV